jgi:radical SAM-linked protein
MIRPEETRRRQALITGALGGRQGAIQFKPHDSRQSSIEGALALGDRRVGTAVLHAWRAGQRLDGWSEWFDEGRWLAAFAECERVHGVGLDFYAHRRRPLDEVLPWDRIDCGVTKAYLQAQLAAARSLTEVPDCVLEACSDCGACDQVRLKNRIHLPADYPRAPAAEARPEPSPLRSRVRLRYTKLGRVVALSHLETMHALLRAFRRARLPMAFSQGYHPKPKVSFGPALPVGVESRCELIDLDLVGEVEAEEVEARLRPQLPEGLALESVELLPLGAPSIGESLRAQHYIAVFPEDPWADGRLVDRVEAYLAQDRAVVHRTQAPKNKDRKRHQKIAGRKQREIDLKDIVTHVGVEGPNRVAFSLRVDPAGSARPAEVLAAIFGDDGGPPLGVKLLKEGVSLARTERDGPQGQPRAPRYLDA